MPKRTEVPIPSLKPLVDKLEAVHDRALAFMASHRQRHEAVDELQQASVVAAADIGRSVKDAARRIADRTIPGGVSSGDETIMLASPPTQAEASALSQAIELASQKARAIELEQVGEVRQDVGEFVKDAESFQHDVVPGAANEARRSLLFLAAVAGDRAAERTVVDATWRHPSLNDIVRDLSTGVHSTDHLGKICSRIQTARGNLDTMVVQTRQLEKQP